MATCDLLATIWACFSLRKKIWQNCTSHYFTVIYNNIFSSRPSIPTYTIYKHKQFGWWGHRLRVPAINWLIFLFSKPINALLLVDENVIATGDDEGTLKVWDMRKSTSFMSLKPHEDYISDIAADPEKRTLLASRYCANSKGTHLNN